MAGIRIYLTERLKEKLSRILLLPLTLVSAPMGYGKTTALKEYLISRKEDSLSGAHVVWRPLLGGTKQEFWEDFRSAFRKEDDEFYRFLISSQMPETSGEKRSFAAAFLEFSERKEEPYVLVFDGLEDGEYREIRDFIHFFAGILPEHVHLVLSGRGTECCNDGFFYIYGLANQIGHDDFLFSIRDMEQYFRINGVNLPVQNLRNLYGTCAGWNVLVHINLREYLERKSFLSEHEMYGLIENVVCSRMPEETVRFLSVLAYANTFSEEEAEFLWEKGNAGQLLSQLERRGLFLDYDRSGRTYRLAHVFQGYFMWKNRQLPEEEEKKWLNRLAEWYLKNDENERARRLYYRIKNFDALMNAVERRRFIVMYGLDEQEFISYYTDCPTEIRAKHPKAILTFARQMFAFGHHEMGKEVCVEFERIMGSRQDLDEETRSWLMGTYELLLCYAEYNDLSVMLPHIHKTKKLLENRKALIPWPDTGLNDSLSLLYMYHRKAGELENETRLFSEYNPLYSSLIGGRLDGADLIMQAERLYVTGAFQEAEIEVYKALLVIHRDKQWHTWLCAVMLQIRIALARGNWHTIEHLLGEVEDSVSLKKEYRVFPVRDMIEIFLYGKLGRPENIRARFDADVSSQFMLCFRAAPMLYCFYGEALLARGEYLQLLAVSEQYMEAARVYPNLYAEIILSMLIAGAYEALGNMNRAKEFLSRALELAAPDRMLVPFAEFGRYIGRTLQEMEKECTEGKAELEEICRMKKQYQESVGKITSEHFSNPPTGLTAREMEIAKLAAKRLSNKEIADQLFISESTVKTQLAHVFSKLEIQKRRDLNRFFPEK